MLLFTGDRDMYQLTTDHVKIVSTKKGVTDVVIMDPATVEDLYHGITPGLVPDFYGLKGDTSDNIPGVPGIGPKKAAALIVQYGSLDEVIAHADEVKGKMGENLRAHVDDALVSRKGGHDPYRRPHRAGPLRRALPHLRPVRGRARVLGARLHGHDLAPRAPCRRRRRRGRARLPAEERRVRAVLAGAARPARGVTEAAAAL